MTVTLRSGTLPSWRNPAGSHREKRRELIDVRERRIAPANVQLRAARNGDLVATGYASTFDEYEVYGGPENYGWIETLARNAFNKTLREKPDVVYLINHDGLPLARTKSGTLKLGVDDGGLAVEAVLEPTDPDVLRIKPKMERGDLDEMSFAFYVKAQQWSAAPGYEEDDMSYREIREVSLHRGDVSVVTFGANPNTSAALGIYQADDRSADRSYIDLAPGRVKAAIEVVERGLEQGANVTVAWEGDTTTTSLQVLAQEDSDGNYAIQHVNDKLATGTPANGLSLAAARTDAPAPEVRTDAGQQGQETPADCLGLAEARQEVGLVQSVADARQGDKPADTPPGTLTLADARASV